jgi:hypothetical protein
MVNFNLIVETYDDTGAEVLLAEKQNVALYDDLYLTALGKFLSAHSRQMK